jgi:hypothetical protein
METHAGVLRLELSHSNSHEVLKNIETNTGTVAQFFKQLESVTALAAGKNQVSITLVIVMLILGAVGVFIVILRESNLELRIPWAGIEITHAKEGDATPR